MIVITGASGFIGSCIVATLNKRKQHDLILVDQEKNKNLVGKKYKKFYHKEEFLHAIIKNDLHGVEAIIHMGACSSTTLRDKEYFEVNNFRYTQTLVKWCAQNKVRLIYASSAATYGDGSKGYCDNPDIIHQYTPLNDYGISKQKLDSWVLQHNYLDRVAGLKFFNVFGPNESHKGDMQSVIAKSYRDIIHTGKIKLFKSYKADYQNGEQCRDFVYVKDVVAVVLFFLDHPNKNGIFNVGTGQAQSWNHLAYSLFKVLARPLKIEYIDMPDHLKKQYQYFTEADITHLREVGFSQTFTKLEDAIFDYCSYLKDNLYM